MGKTAFRWRTRDDWRIGGHESWLRDMATRGLFLKKAGLFFYRFEKSEPRPVRYRIVPVRDIPMTLQQKIAGAPEGWDFVTSFRIFNVYSSPDEANAPELSVTPAEYARNLGRANDRLLIGFAFSFIAVLSFVQSMADIFSSPTPYLQLIGQVPAALAAELAAVSYALYLLLSAFISITRLKKSLLAGNPINHEEPWQKRRRTAIAGTAAAFSFLVFLIGYSLTQASVELSPAKTLPAGETSLPIVRLADIEKNPYLVRNTGYIADGADYNNNIRQASGLLAPVQIKSNESGLIKTEKSKGGSGEYTPAVSNTVYKLAFASMADNIIRDLIYYYEDMFKETADYNRCTEISSPYFDKLFVLKEDSFFEMFAAKGKVVVHITYGGNAGSDAVIKAAAGKIALIKQ